MTTTTLPTDSEDRKNVPMMSGCLEYFPAALAGVARHSKKGNDKHNPGQELHHSRGKSSDHADCQVRHLMDLADMLRNVAQFEFEFVTPQMILDEANANAWRALALSQELHERFSAVPLAPRARVPDFPQPDPIYPLPPNADGLAKALSRMSAEAAEKARAGDRVPQTGYSPVAQQDRQGGYEYGQAPVGQERFARKMKPSY